MPRDLVDQRDAEILLQLPDLHAERRLRNEQLLGRPGHRPGFDHLDEVPELSEVHRDSRRTGRRQSIRSRVAGAEDDTRRAPRHDASDHVQPLPPDDPREADRPAGFTLQDETDWARAIGPRQPGPFVLPDRRVVVGQ